MRDVADDNESSVAAFSISVSNFEHSVNVSILTSFSEVPHRVQDLHSMHCHWYVRTARIMLSVNCRHEGWPERKNERCKELKTVIKSH